MRVNTQKHGACKAKAAKVPCLGQWPILSSIGVQLVAEPSDLHKTLHLNSRALKSGILHRAIAVRSLARGHCYIACSGLASVVVTSFQFHLIAHPPRPQHVR